MEKLEERLAPATAVQVGDELQITYAAISESVTLTNTAGSIAVAGATDLAASCANVVILRGDLDRVPVALAIARSARRVMRQNLGWAIGYNFVAIPLAAFGLLSPAIAALAMAASSVSVVLNSLRAYPAEAAIDITERISSCKTN